MKKYPKEVYRVSGRWRGVAVVWSVILVTAVLLVLTVGAAGSVTVTGWEDTYGDYFSSVTSNASGSNTVSFSNGTFTLKADDGDGCKQGGSVTLFLIAKTKIDVSYTGSVSETNASTSGSTFSKGDEIYFKLNEASSGGSTADISLTVTISSTLFPEDEGLPKHASFRVSGENYPYLDQAISAAVSGDTIIVTSSGTAYSSDWASLEDGAQITFTIPAGVKLLVPYDNGYTSDFDDTPTVVGQSEMSTGTLSQTNTLSLLATDSATTYAYTELIIPSNTTLNINGSLNVNSGIYVSTFYDTGCPHGPYGQITLKDETSQLVIENGGSLYCYGYIIGAYDGDGNYTGGQVTAKSGAIVYELFQIRDWRGGNVLQDYVGTIQTFPVTQYYIQNIEAKYEIQAGATSKIAINFYLMVSNVQSFTDYVGTSDTGLFRIISGSVTRCYNPKSERITYDVNENSKISLNNIKLTVSGVELDSAQFILNLTSQTTVNARAGSTININQRLKMVPGTKINIDSGATLDIAAYNEANGTNGALYIYDAAAYHSKYSIWAPESNTTAQHTQSVDVPVIGTVGYLIVRNYNNVNTQNDIVRYSPSREAYYGADATITSPGLNSESAQLTVNGTLVANGNVFTVTGYTINGTSYTATNSADKVITGTGIVTNNLPYTVNSDTSIGYGELDECYNNKIANAYKIPCQPALGNLAGIGTLQPFGTGTYYGQANGYWYNYLVTTGVSTLDSIDVTNDLAETKETEETVVRYNSAAKDYKEYIPNVVGFVTYDSTGAQSAFTFTVDFDATSVSAPNATVSPESGAAGTLFTLADVKADTVLTINRSDFDVKFTQIVLGNDLDMRFAFDATLADQLGASYAVATKVYADGRDNFKKTVEKANWVSVTIDGKLYYYFTFNNVSGKEMADNVYITIYNSNDEPISNEYTESIRSYILRILENQDTLAKTMLVDMLNYGAAAQEYYSYGLTDMATEGLTEAQLVYATAAYTADETNAPTEPNYLGTRLELKNSINMQIAFSDLTEDMYAVVTLTNHRGKEITSEQIKPVISGSSWYFDINQIVVADGRIDVTITVYDAGGNQKYSVTDSVKNYVDRKLNDSTAGTTLRNLCEKIMMFSDSAYAYLHKNDNQ